MTKSKRLAALTEEERAQQVSENGDTGAHSSKEIAADSKAREEQDKAGKWSLADVGITPHVPGIPAPAPALPRPSIGRMVHYKLRGKDIMSIQQPDGPHLLLPRAVMLEGQTLPATIVRVIDERGDLNAGTCNLNVQLDGAAPDLWVQNITRGDLPGQWNWPPRV